MRLEAAIEGNLKEYMKKEIAAAETAVTAGVKEVTEHVKTDLRTQVVSAGLGPGASPMPGAPNTTLPANRLTRRVHFQQGGRHHLRFQLRRDDQKQ